MERRAKRQMREEVGWDKRQNREERVQVREKRENRNEEREKRWEREKRKQRSGPERKEV